MKGGSQGPGAVIQEAVPNQASRVPDREVVGAGRESMAGISSADAIWPWLDGRDNLCLLITFWNTQSDQLRGWDGLT